MIAYTHRKYCEVCGKYFYYTLNDVINEATVCPLNAIHETSNCRIIMIEII